MYLVRSLGGTRVLLVKYKSPSIYSSIVFVVPWDGQGFRIKIRGLS